jgi:plasmid segregation protein ParM
MEAPVVRAVDVGYGHVKFTDGINPTTNDVRTDSFPSQAPVASGDDLDVDIMLKRDTFAIPIGDKVYEVGKGVANAVKGVQVTENLSGDFCLSDGYAARLYGALNYMAPRLHGAIDCLVLGLPLTTYTKHHAALAARFTGRHTINQRGDKIDIRRVAVYPQPLGAYAAYIASNQTNGKVPTALIVDPGYNTVDWFTCTGMQVNPHCSDAVQRGMAHVVNAIADHVIKSMKSDASRANVVRRIDEALTRGAREFEMHGRPLQLADVMTPGEDVIEQAAQAVKNSVGAGDEIDVIVMAGGGAELYAPAIQVKFPLNTVVTLKHPNFANVRGFQGMGEKIARSAARALGQVAG